MTSIKRSLPGDEAGSTERPSKMVKSSLQPLDGQVENSTIDISHSGGQEHRPDAGSIQVSAIDDSSKEHQVGITVFVRPAAVRFTATLKKRYSDFLVNEILPGGDVLHLRDLKAPKVARGNISTIEDSAVAANNDQTNEKPVEQAPQSPKKEQADPTLDVSDPNSTEVTPQDQELLKTYFDDVAVADLLKLYAQLTRPAETNNKDVNPVKAAFTSDRSVRTQVHQNVRRIFKSKIDSSTDHNGMLILSPAPLPRVGQQNRQQQHRKRGRGKPSWADRGGNYVHFTLYKENKDTMEVISYITRQLRTNAKAMQFAGTKDRRAVTVQRLSGYRLEAERLAGMNKMLRGSAIGDFQYHQQPLELGDLKGNEFVITLRDCRPDHGVDSTVQEKVDSANPIVGSALKDLHDLGFLNYYGLQRFGTFSTRTDVVGIKLLQGDFTGACDMILAYPAEILHAAQNTENTQNIGSDDRYRAQAIDLYRKGGDIRQALETMPRKFSTEANLIRHLGKSPNDYYGALMMVQRNMRLMYVHAYQSLVWNNAVNERWKRYGNEVVEGDLVMVNEHKDTGSEGKSLADAGVTDVDGDGEIVVEPNAADKAVSVEDAFERARHLTSDEAASGDYSIFDIVLPLPGYDVKYPKNEMEQWYKDFMASEEGGQLDPYDMRRKQRDFSLSGSYRKVMARIGPDYSVDVRAYAEDDEQFVTTDLARLTEDKSHRNGDTTDDAKEGHDAKEKDKIAVILKFQLGSSQYATMALRELSQGGIEQYKPDFSGGR